MPRFKYDTPEERQALIGDHVTTQEKVLVEEQDHLDGMFLVFEDTVREDPVGEFRKLPIGSLTPAQVGAYIDNNVTNLAEAKAVLKTLGKMVLWLAKERR